MNSFSRFAGTFLFVVAAAASAFGQDGAMTNKDVVALTKSGIAAEIIVAKIKGSPGAFDTSAGQLTELKDAGVADAVVLAMVQYPKGSASVVVSEGDNVIPGESQAIVYVYRRKEFQTRSLQPSVFIDETEVARIDDGKYFYIKLDPGKHKVYVNKGFSGAALDMKPGRKYYFRVIYKPGFWKARSEMEYVTFEQGQLEIANMKPLEAKWIKDKDRVKVDQIAALTP